MSRPATGIDGAILIYRATASEKLRQLGDIRRDTQHRCLRNPATIIDRGSLIGSAFSATLGAMDYRGIRYTLRAGIERGQWSVVIYPQGVETSGVRVLGTRNDAELHARRLIKKDGCNRNQAGGKRAIAARCSL